MGILKTEIMRKYSETTKASMNSRIQEMEERISGVEEKVHLSNKILNPTKA